MSAIRGDAGLAKLHRTLSRFGPPPVEQWPEFANLFHARHLNRGEHWLAAGEAAHSIAFVEDGILRMYYLALDGKERNKARRPSATRAFLPSTARSSRSWRIFTSPPISASLPKRSVDSSRRAGDLDPDQGAP